MFFLQKIRFYDFVIKPTKQLWRLKHKKNDVMRQAGYLGDSYNSKTTPLNICKIHTAFLKPLSEMCRANEELI